MKKTNKRRIILGIAVVMVIVVVTLLHYRVNYKQYIKYCEEECTAKVVSNQVLEDVITTRIENETKQIKKEAQEINLDVVKLNNADLDTKEQQTYTKSRLKQVYDATAKYDVDQIIALADEYEQTLADYDKLIKQNETRILKEKINKKQKQIDKLLTEIDKLYLTSEEQTDYQKSLDYYNQIDYNSDKNYIASQLNVYLSEYGLSEVNFENDLQNYQMMR